MSAAPDVTVVVPVYNTLSHLEACLDSLVEQTIGVDRLQVVAVDDGSTDGSGELLDAYAERHPGVFTVVHQANSGGPAGPCNVALDIATGRFVFFLGSDDWLGREALERMVTKADEWGSDVVCVRLVGTNGRTISETLFLENQPEIPFPDQRPWLTANTKLFRRSVLEEHHVRYQEDIRVASDQTFTIEAMYRSRRISVLGDYDYYYAVLRPEGGNIMFRDDWRGRLDAIDATMDYVADLIGTGDLLDAVLVRHLKWEYGNRLRDVEELPEADRVELVERTKVACDRYLTAEMRRLMPVVTRLRLWHAQSGDLASLQAFNAAVEAADNRVPVQVRDGRVYLGYPGFDTPDGPTAEWYEETNDLDALRSRFRAFTRSLTLDEGRLAFEVELSTDPRTAASAGLELAPQPGTGDDTVPAPAAPAVSDVGVTTVDDDTSVLRFAVDAAALAASDRHWQPWLHVRVGEHDVRARIRIMEPTRVPYGDLLLVARPNKYKGVVLLARPDDSSARPARRSRWRRFIPWTSA